MLVKHKKTGKFYELVGTGMDCTIERADTPVVIYKATKPPYIYFVREVDEFWEKFEEHKE